MYFRFCRANESPLLAPDNRADRDTKVDFFVAYFHGELTVLRHAVLVDFEVRVLMRLTRAGSCFWQLHGLPQKYAVDAATDFEGLFRVVSA